MIDFKTIRKTDSEIADVYAEELNRQETQHRAYCQ